MVATGAIEETLADLRERGVVYDARRRGVAALHRLRRRQGPGARQERRRVHLPAARHRLPPRQVRPGLRPAHRRVGRRPPRLRPPHEGRHRRPWATTPTSSRSSITQLVACERGGEAVKISKRTGDIDRAATTCSTRSAPTPPASPTCCSRSTRPRPSTSTSSSSQANENPVFYVQMAYARISSIGRVAAERGVERAAAGTRSTSSLLTHERELECCARCPSCPTSSSLAARRAGPAQGHHLGAGAGRGGPRLLPRLLRWLRADSPDDLTQARLWLVEAAGDRPAPSASTCSGSAPPTQM